MKNYGMPNGVPFEEALQAYLNDHMGPNAPRVTTETGEGVGFSIIEWFPGDDVWDEMWRAVDSIGHEVVMRWTGEEVHFVLRQCRSGWDIPDTIRLFSVEKHLLSAKRTGTRCPHCGGFFQPRGTCGGGGDEA